MTSFIVTLERHHMHEMVLEFESGSDMQRNLYLASARSMAWAPSRCYFDAILLARIIQKIDLIRTL
jgi:hypothetical protein